MGNDRHKREDFDNYKNYIEELENEYLETFKKIEIYIDGSTKLNTLEKNDCFLQILDTFLSSQVEGKSIKSITGTDLKKYCDNMIYGETIYIYKASKVFNTITGALFYISIVHFIIRIIYSIDLKDSSSIFQPMSFGIGESILLLDYLCIPKLVSVITRNYFENPVRCKKVRRNTSLAVWTFTCIIYSFMEVNFNEYGILISFSSLVLFFIYSVIASLSIRVLTGAFDNENSENKKEKREQQYFWLLKKEYEKHKVKCDKRNKKPLDWDKFLKKKTKDNYVFIIVFFVYGVIFLGSAILIGRGMLVKGNIDVVGIVALILVSFITLVMIVVVKEGIDRNKQLELLQIK